MSVKNAISELDQDLLRDDLLNFSIFYDISSPPESTWSKYQYNVTWIEYKISMDGKKYVAATDLPSNSGVSILDMYRNEVDPTFLAKNRYSMDLDSISISYGSDMTLELTENARNLYILLGTGKRFCRHEYTLLFDIKRNSYNLIERFKIHDNINSVELTIRSDANTHLPGVPSPVHLSGSPSIPPKTKEEIDIVELLSELKNFCQDNGKLAPMIPTNWIDEH